MIIIISIVLGIFFAIAIAALIIVNRKKAKEEPEKEEVASNPALDCCGAHEVCEVDKLKVNTSLIEYFNDEDLDTYKDIPEDDYSDEQIDEFREVLYTLKTNEINLWLISIERRKINLPAVLKDEARMLIAEG